METAGPLRVLVIEDEELDARLVVNELQRDGRQIVWERVETKETLAAALERGGWDLLISDYRLPRLRAPEALALYRTSGLDAPFIVVSGTVGEEQAVELLKAGASDFFLKDRLTRLPAAVERELREADSRRARRRAEEQLRRSHRSLEEAHERSRRASEVAKVGVWDWDLATGELYVDPALKALLGFSDQELGNHADAWGRRVHHEDVARVRAELEAHLDGHKPVYEVERRLLHKDGSARWFLSRGVAVRDAAGRPTRLLGADLDVTERRQLEAMFQQSQKLEAVGRLAGGVAHDFNNLLGVITGYGELAQRQVGSEHPVRARLDQIVKAAERAAGLTRQLLAFSRKQVLQPKVLDLNVLLRDLDRMLHRVIGEDVELQVRQAQERSGVKADPTQLEQVILNLVVNARDAMPAGGRLTIETSAVELDEAFARAHPPARAGRYVLLSVSDSGSGMDAETQRRIFEPFFTTKPPGEGTGLGLATVYGVVKQSDGYIWVDSEPGHGATFRVYLPRVDEPSSPVPRPEADPAPRGYETVLLVEDTESLREVIREVLVQHGYALLLAADGQHALALAREHPGPIDLLLTDLVMPRLGGAELARQLTALRPGLRVLYMSGYTDGAISRQGLAGALLLEKPFSGGRLARAVHEALRGPSPRG